MRRFLAVAGFNAVVMISAAMIAVSGGASAGSHLYRLYVEGLACPICGYALEMRLRKLVGVVDVQADYREGVVTITMLDGLPLNEGAAMQTVRDAGFTPMRVERVTDDRLITPAPRPLSN